MRDGGAGGRDGSSGGNVSCGNCSKVRVAKTCELRLPSAYVFRPVPFIAATLSSSHEVASRLGMNWLQANAAELIGDGLKLNVLGLIAATGTVVWQLRRQHRNSLALQRENAREAIKLPIYETLVQRIRALSDANIDAARYAFGILPAIESLQRERSAGNQPPVEQRVPTFSVFISGLNAAVFAECCCLRCEGVVPATAFGAFAYSPYGSAARSNWQACNRASAPFSRSIFGAETPD